MTLEDFFTLTEMKGGLSSLVRVDELVSVMKKEKNYTIKNFSDEARQWSTVAAILEATDNIDCLNRFIRLEGLCFLDRWLQEAQRFNGDENDECSKEAISALLGALEKLPINTEKSGGSGIGVTVRHLFGHKSLDIQKRARNLLNGCVQVKATGTKTDVGKAGICNEVEHKHPTETKLIMYSGCLKNSVPNAFASKINSSDRCPDSPDVQSQQLKVSNPDRSQGMLVGGSNKSPHQADSFGVKASIPCAAVPKSDIVAETSSANSVEESASASSCASLTPRDLSDNKPSGVPEPDVADSVKENANSSASGREGSSCKSSVTTTLEKEETSVSSTSRFSANIEYRKTMEDATLLGKLDADSDFSPKPSVDPSSKNGRYEPHLRSKKMKLRNPKSKGETGFVHRESCSVDEIDSQKLEGPKAFSTEAEASMKHNNKKEHNNGTGIVVKPGEGVPSSIEENVCKDHRKDLEESGWKLSEMKSDYGADEVLECARQVVEDLEKEVGTFKEPLDRSPFQDTADQGTMNSSTPEQPPTGRSIYSNEQLCEVSSNIGVTPQEVLKQSNKEAVNQLHERDSSQSPPVAQELGSVACRCAFDLNEDVHMEENERLKVANTSHPIKVIAASKGAAGLPITPLHFEGELGWKGTAATSAFRPASPRKTVDVEKADASSHIAKPSQNVLKFDLNIAECDVDVVTVPTEKQVLFASSLRSGDSSVEVSSKRAERLNLDLNRVDDEDICRYTSSDWRTDKHMHLYHNGQRFSSPSSSSRQSAMRNIDLNDSLFFLDPTNFEQQKNDKLLFQPLKYFANRKLDDPVTSIMGSRMDLERKDFPGPTQPFFVSGHGSSALAMTASTGRAAGEAPRTTTLAYSTSQLPFSYNGLAIGPPMLLSSGLYAPGHLPYMVDARGATVIPQILDPPMQSSFSRPPFFMSVTSAPSDMNSVGVMRPVLDLNSAMSVIDRANWEGNSRPLFIHSHGSLMDETVKSAAQQVGGVGATLKRKEPECGWEPYANGFKHVAPWRA